MGAKPLKPLLAQDSMPDGSVGFRAGAAEFNVRCRLSYVIAFNRVPDVAFMRLLGPGCLGASGLGFENISSLNHCRVQGNWGSEFDLFSQLLPKASRFFHEGGFAVSLPLLRIENTCACEA